MINALVEALLILQCHRQRRKQFYQDYQEGLHRGAI